MHRIFTASNLAAKNKDLKTGSYAASNEANYSTLTPFQNDIN